MMRFRKISLTILSAIAVFSTPTEGMILSAMKHSLPPEASRERTLAAAKLLPAYITGACRELAARRAALCSRAASLPRS